MRTTGLAEHVSGIADEVSTALGVHGLGRILLGCGLVDVDGYGSPLRLGAVAPLDFRDHQRAGLHQVAAPAGWLPPGA